MNTVALSDLDKRLLSLFQKDMPLGPRPYAKMAAMLGVSERDVIDALKRLQDEGAISRVGAVFRPNRIGCSTLAAMAVPADHLDAVAAVVSRREEVNHNYERSHRLNLWFVVTAADEDGVHRAITEIELETGFAVLDLPMVEDFHLDLGFDLT